MITHVAVLVPACNEETRISGSLRAILASTKSCSATVSVIVVADHCHDDTARIARRFRRVNVVEIQARNVGTARRTAAEHALRGLEIPPDSVWLANTDADSIVPTNWLSSQISHANDGYDVVIGTVRPDPREYPASLQTEWDANHIKGKPNGHIHGANLGIRASAYLEAGGYKDLAEHEDVDLVCRLSGRRHIATDDAEVITSARLDGRTPGGYAAHIRRQLEKYAI